MIEWGFTFDEEWCAQSKGEEMARNHLVPFVRSGFRWWEIPAPETVSDFHENRIREWSRFFGLHVSVHARFVGINLASSHALVQEAAVRVAEEDLSFAQRLDAKRMVIHAGSVNWYDVTDPAHAYYRQFQQRFEYIRNRYAQAAIEALAVVAQIASRLGIEIFLENLYFPWEFPRTPKETGTFLRALKDQVGFAFDTGHAMISGYGLEEYYPLFQGRSGHVHLHWNDKQYDLHLMPRVDDQEVREIVERLPRFLNEGVVIIEVSPTKHRAALLEFIPKMGVTLG